tara:strand:+ start:695 stop:1537 length:843 start_codon:yes stop_codon:yes gene_type:complete
MNIGKAISEATNVLSKKGIKSSQLDSEILMSKVFKKDRKFIILNLQKKIKKNLFYLFKEFVYQRSCGKPIAYLTGKKNFWSNEFVINQNVLIPRPDTEIIIEEVLKLSKHKNKFNILEIGVGSGCILLSILNEKKNFRGIGIDISKECLELSKINAFKIGLKNHVKFIKSDVDNFNNGKYDLIVSNPPYIESVNLKNLDKGVVNFEPKLALDGGLDGLSAIRKIVKKSSELIKINGKLVLEIGYNQKNKVKQILKNNGFYINRVLKDYANNDRCIVSTKK